MRCEMKPFLNALNQNHSMEIWCYEMINAGDKWKGEIHQHMATVRVAVLMVSQAFLNFRLFLKWSYITLVSRLKMKT